MGLEGGKHRFRIKEMWAWNERNMNLDCGKCGLGMREI